MAHEHHLHGDKLMNRLSWAFGLTLVIFFAELIGGIMANSLALLSDAGHLFADVIALGLSLIAMYIARFPANSRKTFGYHRAEILAAIINALTLIIIAVAIFLEAYKRFSNPEPVKTMPMLIVAVIGLFVNIFVFIKLHSAAKTNLNIRAAFLHVVGDMLASIGVIAGGIIMLYTGNFLVDPIISVLVGLIILKGAYGVLKEGTNILLEGVPHKLNYDNLTSDILAIPGVLKLHDLHIWELSASNIMLSVHVHVDSAVLHAGRDILIDLKDMLSSKYHIVHSTIQFECDCCTSPGESVCFVNKAHEDL
jgi:cobalt-zinc-cadmium efflux system protein